MSAIEVSELTKSYDGRVVVDGVSFTVEEGEILAIVGPNGAGKSTTVESIAGLRTPDSGSIKVFGFDPLQDRTEVREALGVQPRNLSSALALPRKPRRGIPTSREASSSVFRSQLRSLVNPERSFSTS